MIIGFAWGGWVLGSNSLNMGEEMAQAAILEGLLAAVLQFAGRGALQKLEEIERQRRQHKEYWDEGTQDKSPGN